MYDLDNFSLTDMTRCGIDLRRMGKDASSAEEAAVRIVKYLHQSLGIGGRDESACALVRFYLTVPYLTLPQELQEFADKLVGTRDHAATMKCLTLLATAGELPEWNSREKSAGHKALPLLSEESISRSPMISQLIRQLGIPVAHLLGDRPDLVIDQAQHTFNVFHVPDALGSQHIPAQADFVVPFGIKSVIGFGGMLPNGEMFSIILFSKSHIPRERAQLFNTLALNAKLAIMPFDESQIFA
ncbi:MAG: hypothetical protein M3Z17_10875 [Gemmatimonadota bacterium]|nr:hypothetical protein [Gemmatimonadota bacterium]